jgi:flavin reductase (DIM6/NTAB) family NADH-FMN oxidoreductase RutF
MMPEASFERPYSFVEQEDFRSAMRRLAGGVTLVTAGQGESRRGLTATAVCSLSMDPPSLLVGINRQSECLAVIEKTGSFGFNIISQAHKFLSGKFAGRCGVSGCEKFDAGQWSSSLVNCVPLLDDALVAIDCRVLDMIERGSHMIVIGGAQEVRVRGRVRDNALVYWQGAYGVLQAAGLRR